MPNRSIMLTLVAALISSPALAQGYHANSGGGRVVYQNQTGLQNPSSTYIGSGTLSKSAQGFNTQAVVPNPGLPNVNMGANIRTPGDNMYRPKQQTLPSGRMGANVGMPGDRMRSDLNYNYYVPGQNYGTPQRPQYFYRPGSSGGVATYGDSSVNQNYNSRRF